jgi:hypothetical protein
MIVMQYTFQIKQGKFYEALELAKDGRKNIWPNITSRIYSSNIGPMNTIIIENEFNDLAEQRKQAERVGAKEEWDPWVEKWFKLVTGPSKNVVWNLE